jgi:hypothetical protein
LESTKKGCGGTCEGTGDVYTIPRIIMRVHSSLFFLMQVNSNSLVSEQEKSAVADIAAAAARKQMGEDGAYKVTV